MSITLRFTDHAEPLYINTDSDLSDTLFVIATTQMRSVSQPNSQNRQRSATPNVGARGQKRPLEEDNNHMQANGAEKNVGDRPMRPMRVVQRTDRRSMANEIDPPPPRIPTQEPQPSWAVLTAAQRRSPREDHYAYDDFGQGDDAGAAGPSDLSHPGVARARARTPVAGASQWAAGEQEPLFLPGSQLSQLPPAQQAAIIESGLGIEHMTAEEFEMMLDGDADEVDFGEAASVGALDFDALEVSGERQDSLEIVEDDDIEMAPTQAGGGGKVSTYAESWSWGACFGCSNVFCAPAGFPTAVRRLTFGRRRRFGRIGCYHFSVLFLHLSSEDSLWTCE